MVLQDHVESFRPDQISLVVDPIPVVPSALVQTRVYEGEWLPALVHLMELKLPVAEDVGRRRALAIVVGALGVRLCDEVILSRGGWRRWVSDRRRRRGRVPRLHVAQPGADFLVPGQWPVSLLVLLQHALGAVLNRRRRRRWRRRCRCQAGDAALRARRRRIVGGLLALHHSQAANSATGVLRRRWKRRRRQRRWRRRRQH